MDLTPPPRLPAHLESAVQRVRMAARSAAEHTVDTLGLAAMATHHVLQRDALLGAQYELNRKLAIFALTFNEALETDVARQAGTLQATPGPAVTAKGLMASWESLSLVDHHEVEIHLSADRFALEISHACEWEIRELDAYMGTLLGLDGPDHDRNPLRAEVVGQAMIRAIEAIADRPEVRKVLCTEIARSLAHAMRQTYTDVVADLRQAGVRPIGLTLRQTPSPRSSVQSGLGASGSASRIDAAAHASSRQGRLNSASSWDSGRSDHGALSHAGPPSRHGGRATLGQIDGTMMALIRQLAQGRGSALSSTHSDSLDLDGAGDFALHPGQAQLASPNLILAHRDQLRQVASGELDHRVIDVIAGLFDQILSDPKVAPQIARQIARLQLPVLRAALGDSSFFSSQRHPVRRFVNRIASLGSAVEDFNSDDGRALLTQVTRLVQEVVDGDFEQITVYEQKLQALERFTIDQSLAQLKALSGGATEQILARKEAGLRLQQGFAQALDAALQGLPVPGYLREFLAQVWSQAIANAAASEGPSGALTQRLRDAGRELVMSVQPKGSPERRQQFLRGLPPLMRDLNLGLDRIGHPEDQRRQFFAQLLPAHAESLKGQAPSTLAHNLLLRQVDAALATPLPLAPMPATGPAAASDGPGASGASGASGSSAATNATADNLAASPSAAAFTPAEAQAVRLLDDAAVDWLRPVDIDLGTEPELQTRDLAISGLPTPEAIEPTRGKSLADHVQIGFAYRMQLQGDWQKVRLMHVSAGRNFFVFSHGAQQRSTLSMTQRMLVKLCDGGRLRALENAYLLERATARARRQLSTVAPRKR